MGPSRRIFNDRFILISRTWGHPYQGVNQPKHPTDTPFQLTSFAESFLGNILNWLMWTLSQTVSKQIGKKQYGIQGGGESIPNCLLIPKHTGDQLGKGADTGIGTKVSRL